MKAGQGTDYEVENQEAETPVHSIFLGSGDQWGWLGPGCWPVQPYLPSLIPKLHASQTAPKTYLEDSCLWACVCVSSAQHACWNPIHYEILSKPCSKSTSYHQVFGSPTTRCWIFSLSSESQEHFIYTLHVEVILNLPWRWWVSVICYFVKNMNHIQASARLPLATSRQPAQCLGPRSSTHVEVREQWPTNNTTHLQKWEEHVIYDRWLFLTRYSYSHSSIYQFIQKILTMQTSEQIQSCLLDKNQLKCIFSCQISWLKFKACHLPTCSLTTAFPPPALLSRGLTPANYFPQAPLSAGFWLILAHWR